MNYKHYISQKINITGISSNEIESLIVLPPNSEMGDYSLPCFKFAKLLRKSPVMIANELASSFECDKIIEKATAVNGYLNFTINRITLAKETISTILDKKENYGSSNEGNGKTICIDYSSVNIAKPFHIGHLSTTVLGGSLYKLFNFLGYKAVGINHLGDYGTQFGKLICAYKHWGDHDKVQQGGIHAVNELYVKFNNEATEEMEKEAREYFRLIESGDKEANELFDWFKSLTLEYVQKIYDKLNVTFDSYAGERFYSDKMQPVIDRLNEVGIMKISDGASIVDLEKYNMPPCLILRSDGASLYATRDLAAAMYRKKTYDFHKCLYVVAYQQNLHFRQIFKTLELMQFDWAKDMVHVAYGMVSLEDGAMSTRKGKVVWLEDVINKCVEKAYEIINEKNPNLANKQECAEKVGIGAVIFGALYNSKIKDITFSYDKVLSFEGETGVYVQYTCARCKSVLDKADSFTYDITSLEPQEFEVVKLLSAFPETLTQAAEKYEPCFIARYAVDLAQAYNKFYLDCKILTAPTEIKNKRLAITSATLYTLKNALRLLGIKAPDKM